MKNIFTWMLLIILSSACASNRYLLQDASEENMVLVDLIKESPELSGKPLIVLDGKPYRYDVELKQDKLPLRSSDIHEVDVIKADKGEQIWGDVAKGGVILLTSRAALKQKKKSKIMIDCTQPVKKDKILFLLGDRKITESEMKMINPADIESISVLKKAEEIKKYTSEDYDGLVIIILKTTE